MATARLRKAFRYPEEDEGLATEMDEEQQEKLIADLQEQDATKTDLYRKAFLALPLSAALFFFVTVFLSVTARQRLVALLGLSSLLCTAYILMSMPAERQDKKGKRAVYRVEAERSPVEKYLVYLNASLTGLLLISAAANWRRGASETAWREALPASAFFPSAVAV